MAPLACEAFAPAFVDVVTYDTAGAGSGGRARESALWLVPFVLSLDEQRTRVTLFRANNVQCSHAVGKASSARRSNLRAAATAGGWEAIRRHASMRKNIKENEPYT